jgi:hypothetical protein
MQGLTEGGHRRRSGERGSTVMAPRATPSLGGTPRPVREEGETVRWAGTGERRRSKQRTAAAHDLAGRKPASDGADKTHGWTLKRRAPPSDRRGEGRAARKRAQRQSGAVPGGRPCRSGGRCPDASCPRER